MSSTPAASRHGVGFIAHDRRRKFLFMTWCLAITWPTYVFTWDIQLFMLVHS
jgi:hypothetical protein